MLFNLTMPSRCSFVYFVFGSFFLISLRFLFSVGERGFVIDWVGFIFFLMISPFLFFFDLRLFRYMLTHTVRFLFKLLASLMRHYFPSGAPLHTLSKLYYVPFGFVSPSFKAVYCFIYICRRIIRVLETTFCICITSIFICVYEVLSPGINLQF